MAQKIMWSNRATDDLHHLFESLSTFSDDRAEAIIETIIDHVFLLEQFPKMGRIVPEVNLEMVRELLIQQYRIVYILSSQGGVEILAIRHSSRPFTEF